MTEKLKSTRIVGRKGGKDAGESGGIPPEKPDTLKAVQTARVVELLGEGEVHGLVNDMQSVYLDGTPLQNTDGSFNYQGFNLAFRPGTPEQSVIPGFSSVENEITLEGSNNEVTFGSPITHRVLVTADPPDALRVKVYFPALSFLNDQGVLGPTSVDIKISISVDDSPFHFSVVNDTINGKATSPYVKAYRIRLPQHATSHWDVRVERLTEDSEETRLQNKTFFNNYTEINEAKVMYSDSAIIGIIIDAEQFGSSIPSREYEMFGRILRVPTNYDSSDRTYDESGGPWDGTFKILSSTDTVCRNPVWVLYDLLTHKRYGLGRYITEDDVDRFAFYDAAKWCDEQVPNGIVMADGTFDTEPRYSFNGTINQAEDPFTVLGAIASNCHARLYWGPGVISIAIDKPKDPVGLVAPANVVDGDFQYESAALRDRHSVVNVTWNNPLDGYRTDVERVEDPTMISSFGVRELDVIAPGVTGRAEAFRFGKYLLETEKTENQVVSYKAGLDHAGRVPGDIIEIADPTIAGIRYGGRLVDATGDPITFTLDQAVTFEAGVTYTLSYVTPDGDLVSVELTNPETTTDEVSESTGGLTVPNSGAMWTLSTSEVSTRKFTIASVVEVGGGVYEFSAILHNASKFDTIEEGYVLPDDDDTSLIPTGPILPVLSISSQLVVSKVTANINTSLVVGWYPDEDPRITFYEVEYKRPGDVVFQRLAFTSSLTATLFGITAGVYTFRVTAIDALGRRSQPVTESFDYNTIADPPPDVTDFNVQQGRGSVECRWTAVDDLALHHYEIRHTILTSGVTWDNSIKVAEVPGVNPKGESNEVWFGPLKDGTFLIKAVDVFGRESVNAATDTVNDTEIITYTTVESVYEQTSFPGTHDSTYKDGDDLKLIVGTPIAEWDPMSDVDPLDDANQWLFEFPLGVWTYVIPAGTYTFGNDPVDLGGTYTVRLNDDVVSTTETISANVMANWISLLAVASMAGTNVESTSADLYYRVTPDDPAGSPVWSSWKLLSGDVDVTGRGFEFRVQLKTKSPLYTPVVSTLGALVKMASRTVQGSGTSSAVATTTVTFDQAFYSNDVEVTATVTNGDHDNYVEITNISSTGFDIDIRDAGANREELNFAWIATGTGAKIA